MGVSALPEVGFLPGMVMAYAGPTTQPGWLLCDGSLLNRLDYPQLFGAIGTAYNTGGETGSQFRIPNLKGKTIVMQDAAQAEFDVLGEGGGAKTVTLAATEMPAHGHTVTVDTKNVTSSNVSTDHAHNIYETAGVPSTGGQSANHAHAASTDVQQVDQGWPAGGHWGVRTTDRTPELTYGGAIKGCSVTNNNAVYQDHTHSYDHSHPSTNYQNQSDWPGNYSHEHTANHDHTGSAGTAGGGNAHNNLQPYMTLNYLIKV